MSTALEMYRAALRPLLAIALVSTLPLALLVMGGDLAYGTDGDGLDAALRAAIQAVPALLLGPISAAATTAVAMDLLNGRRPTAGAALELVGVRFWPMAAVILISVLGTVLGLMAFLIPGIVLAVIWLFAPVVSVVEGRGVRASFRRSVALTRRCFWWTLGSYLLIQVTVALAASLAGTVVGLPTLALDGTAAVLSQGLVTLLVTTVVQPVGYLGIALMYLDRRVRAEGTWPSPGPAAEAPAGA
jgi:hypothetical protein